MVDNNALIEEQKKRILFLEEGLQQVQEELEAQSEELEAQLEELRLNNDELEKATLSLRESERKYRIVADNTYDWEFWVDTDGKFLYSSPSCLEMTGYSAKEFINDPDLNFQIIYDEDLPAYRNHYFEEARSGKPGELEYRIITKDGKTKWIDHSCQPVCEKGCYVGTRGCNRDITERKLAEESARASDMRFRSLIQNASDIIRILDKDGRIVYDSPSSEKILGYPPGYTLGKSPLEFMHPDDRARMEKELGEVYDLKNPGTTSEFRIRKADGEYLEMESIGRNMIGVPGVDGIVVTTRPIAERKQAEKEKEISAEFLRLVNDSRGIDDLIRSVTAFFHDKSGFEAVGIRLRDGDDYPYYETRGFSREFVLAETHLCVRDESGLPVCGSDGYPVLECMCGNVIRGRFDHSKPFFTPRGSFWTNNTSKLLATTTEKDRQSRTRNRCNGEGYESVAVIAIRQGNECLGTLQLNDRRIDRFTPESIAMWERLTDYLAVALAKFKAVQAMRESEERFRALADNIPNLAWMANSDGWISWYNKQWYDYTGTTPEEMQGWGWQKVHHPDYVDVVTEEWSSSIKAGQPYDNIFPLRGKDGNYRWFLTRVTPIRDEQGDIQRWFGTNTDITDQIQAEEANAYLAAIVESSEDAIISKTLDGIITSWNIGAEKMFGYTADEVIGKSKSILIPSDHPDELAFILNRVMGGERVLHYETVRLRKDGKRIDVSISVSPIKDGSGNIIGASDIIRDITERKLAEESLQEKQEELEVQAEELVAINEELRSNNEELLESKASRKESEERFRALADNIPNLAWMADAKGWIFWYNKQWYDYTGATLEEMQGWGWQKVHHPDYVDAVTKEWSASIEAGKPYDNIFPLKGKDGNYRWFLTRISPIRDEKGNIVRWFGTNTDITERKQMEEDLKIAKAQAELYLDLMGHDISNMHQIIMGQLELAQEILETDCKLDAVDKTLIDTSLETLDRSAKLIDNVRNLQKLSHGEFRDEIIDLDGLLSNVIMEFDAIVPDESITLVSNGLHYVKGTKLLHDVFTNLVGNAIKHSNKNNIDITLKLDNVKEKGKNYYRVSVEDNGPGISDDMKAKVFNRLQRGKTEARGLGLGLYLVRTLVESFGGFVKVEDRVQGDYTKGAKFLVYLPIIGGEQLDE